jgi:hypothetical protein
MTSLGFLQLFLVLHITGFTMMAGTVLADYTVFRKVSRWLVADRQKALTILQGSAALVILISVGAGLLVTTGIGMVIVFKGTVVHMLWFKIKMVLVVLVVLNGAVLARRSMLKLKGTLLTEGTETNGRVEGLKRRLDYIYITQLILFLTIFVLSVLKF